MEHRQPADELNRELVAYLGHNEIQVAVEDTGYRLMRRGHYATSESLHAYYELPNLARRLLESFLIFKVPNENSLFKRLEAVDFDGPKKTRLQRFLDTHSHAELIAEGHDEASSLAEAPDVLKDLLELIEKCDAEHFQRMKNSISA